MTKQEIQDYIKLHPEMSIRKTATALGVAKTTIERAKKSMSTVSTLPLSTVSTLPLSSLSSLPVSSLSSLSSVPVSSLSSVPVITPKQSEIKCPIPHVSGETHDFIREQCDIINNATTRSGLSQATKEILDAIEAATKQNAEQVDKASDYVWRGIMKLWQLKNDEKAFQELSQSMVKVVENLTPKGR